MNIYAIGDLHLSLNGKVDKPMDIFGLVWENHVEVMKEHWDQTVREEDVVLLCGDLSWALKLPEAMDDLDFIHDRPGKKIIIKGNHDLWWTSIKKLNALYEDMYFLQNDFYPLGSVAIAGSRGWLCPGGEEFTKQDMKIYERELMRMESSLQAAFLAGYGKNKGAEIIVMMHYPPTNEFLEDSGFTELFHEYGVKKVVYGHIHGMMNHSKSLKGEKEGISYSLVSFDYVEGKLEKII
ncbi:MAG: metallophosphoesterase [Anaerovoracaceae bacterium]|nr:serine/threonine protein phosphatase [Clostridiales bacterium]